MSATDSAAPTLLDQAHGSDAVLPARDGAQPSLLRRLTIRDEVAAVQLYREGQSLSAIARTTGMSWESVARLLDRAGVRPTRDPNLRSGMRRRGQVLSDQDVAEARRLRALGWSLQKIADKFGVHRETLRQRLP